VQGVVPQTVDIVEEPVHGHPLAAVIQVLVCVMTPHDPQVSLQADGALHVDQTPSAGQHPVGRQPEVTGVRSA
jgi:hypothetical protein